MSNATWTLQGLESQWQAISHPTVTQAEIQFYRNTGDNTCRHERWYVSAPSPSPSATDEAWVRTLKRRRAFYAMVNPISRGFFHACWQAVQDSKCNNEKGKETLNAWIKAAKATTPDPEKFDAKWEILHPGDNLLSDTYLTEKKEQTKEKERYACEREAFAQVFLAHLRCALVVTTDSSFLSQETPVSALEDIAKDTGQPPPLLYDLAWELVSEKSNDDLTTTRPAPHKVEVTGLLVERNEGKDNGFVATLTLEAVETQQKKAPGQLYPSPALALVARDEKFIKSAEKARDFWVASNLWQRPCDVRWHLQLREGQKAIFTLTGPSMDLAFTIGLGKLLARL